MTFPALTQSPSKESTFLSSPCRISLIARKLRFHAIIDLIGNHAIKTFSDASRFSCFLQARNIFANICPASRLFTREIEYDLSLRCTNYAQKLVFGTMLVTTEALAERYLLYFLFHDSVLLGLDIDLHARKSCGKTSILSFLAYRKRQLICIYNDLARALSRKRYGSDLCGS